MPHRYPRSKRISDLMKEEISLIIHNELKDPRISGIITTTKVELSQDLSLAKVFLSILDTEERKKEIFQTLAKSKGFIKKLLSTRIEIRKLPDIRFEEDKSLDYQGRIEELLHGKGENQ